MGTYESFQNEEPGNNIPLPDNSTDISWNITCVCVLVFKILIFTDYLLIRCLVWFHNYSARTFPIESNQSVCDGSITG